MRQRGDPFGMRNFFFLLFLFACTGFAGALGVEFAADRQPVVCACEITAIQASIENAGADQGEFLIKSQASGALELVPLVTVQNLARALTEMNERGFLTVGLDSQGAENLGAVELRQPLALVLGAEGKGLRQLTRETCSTVARLDMPGEIKSLNVSNAAVLALYIGASRLGLMG